jgi:hypothetical protein
MRASSPTKAKRLFLFRNQGHSNDAGDASSVVPLGDTDKMAQPQRRSSTSSFRRVGLGIFGRGGGGSENRACNSNKSKISSPRSNKSATSQRYLEQMSADEARERRKALELRERRRIEEKRRAYLQQQRAKEMAKGDGLVVDLARPSSSRTAATVQSSVLTDEDDSLLFCTARSRSRSRSGSGSNGLSQQQQQQQPQRASRSSKSWNGEPEQALGIFRNIEFLLSEACPAILPPDISPVGSNVSSSSTTEAPTPIAAATGPVISAAVGVNRSGNNWSSSTPALLQLPLCIVCHARERSHVATPCLHFMYCATCAQKLPSCAVCCQPAEFRPISM